jgi:hypothetical protein
MRLIERFHKSSGLSRYSSCDSITIITSNMSQNQETGTIKGSSTKKSLINNLLGKNLNSSISNSCEILSISGEEWNDLNTSNKKGTLSVIKSNTILLEQDGRLYSHKVLDSINNVSNVLTTITSVNFPIIRNVSVSSCSTISILERVQK